MSKVRSPVNPLMDTDNCKNLLP